MDCLLSPAAAMRIVLDYATMSDWLMTGWTEVVMVLLSLAVVYLAIIFFTRVAGLCSFSKMSAADFAMTVAVGSLFASSIATGTPPLLQALVALAGLFFGQWLFASLRRMEMFQRLLDNRPILLMANGEIQEDNLAAANVTRADLMAKLRESGVLRLQDVQAVVFETTGDVSVLHGDTPLDPVLLDGVRDRKLVEQLQPTAA